MRRVLVVDDDSDVARALERLLMSHGFDVQTCLNAPDALVSLGACAAHVVVTDFQMPGMDGVALLTEVKRQWPATLRVLVSGLADTLGPARLAPCAPCVLIAKPWRTDELLAAVRGGG